MPARGLSQTSRWQLRLSRAVSAATSAGSPRSLPSETARLRRNCHRLVWLNPLAGTPGYQPLAGGMRAAYPYIDDFLPAGTVASLERLGEILGGVRAGDTRRGSEAAESAWTKRNNSREWRSIEPEMSHRTTSDRGSRIWRRQTHETS